MNAQAIFAEHVHAWNTKPGLRHYYQREIFKRITPELLAGRTLELGSGPGFFRRDYPDIVSFDIVPGSAVSVCGDAHCLPFADRSFHNIVGIDVLHHLSRPHQALLEAYRVLKPGGHLVLVEPWAGSLGFLFYRYLHHEDCSAVADPWNAAFAPNKGPMDGNAFIPRALLAELHHELTALTCFALPRIVHFGSLSYAATGGFRPIGLPKWAIEGLCRIERTLPNSVMRHIALRALFVLEKGGKTDSAS